MNLLKKISKTERDYLYDVVKREDLVLFIEREAQVKFHRSGGKYSCVCPMKNHRDTKPSFFVFKKNDIFLYNCFGCGSSGTILDFTIDYGIAKTPQEALVEICQKLNITAMDDMMIKAIRNAKINVDMEQKLENEHIRTADICRNLLTEFRGNIEIEQWVENAYRQMNTLLLRGDIHGISNIQGEAMHINSRGGIFHD